MSDEFDRQRRRVRLEVAHKLRRNVGGQRDESMAVARAMADLAETYRRHGDELLAARCDQEASARLRWAAWRLA